MVTIAMNLLPKDTGIKSTGLLVLSSALVVLSKAMSNMGGMSWIEIAKSLVVLAGSLTIITIAMQAMTGGLTGAAAMMVMSSALMILAPALKILGSMSIGEICVSLIALVGVFAIVGTASIILTPVTPVILALAGAIGLLGVGILAIGGGLLAFATGMTALAIAGTAGTAALVATVSSMLSLIPMFIQKIGEGVIAFARVIAEGTPVIMEAIKAIIKGIITIIGELIPDIVETIFGFIDEMLEKLLEYIPKFTDTGLKILLGFLEGIADNTQSIVEAAISIVINLLEGIKSKIPDVIETGIGVVVAFIEAIGEETPKLVEAGFKMIIDFINGLAETIREQTPLLIDAIANLVEAIIEGITTGLANQIEDVVDSIKEVGTSLIEGFKEILGINSPSKVFNGFAGDIITGLIGGFSSGVSSVSKKAKEIATTVIDNVKEKFEEIGDVAQDVTTGLANGLEEGKNAVVKAAQSIAQSALNSAKDFLDIHSPSRKFKDEVGQNVALGMAEGMENRTDDVAKAAKSMSKTAYDNAKLWIQDYQQSTDYLLSEELAMWEMLGTKYKTITSQKIEIDKNVNKLKEEIIKEQLALEEEAFQHSKNWIQQKKEFQELSLLEEVEAWERVQARYAEGTDLRKEADLELFNARKRLAEEQETLMQKMQDAEDRYMEAVDNRADTISNTFSLFEELKEKEEVAGETLKQNLQDQVDELRRWSDNITTLSKRGIDEGLLEELQKMGPSANTEIAGLVSLTDEQLTEYQNLWKEKNALARIQAINELETLRKETEVEIKAINEELAQLGIVGNVPDLVELGKESIEAIILGYQDKESDIVSTMNDIAKNVNLELQNANSDYSNAGENLMTSVEEGFEKKEYDVKTTASQVINSAYEEMMFASDSFRTLGENTIYGFIEGMRSKIEETAEMASMIARTAYESAKNTLDINSPSRAFIEIGEYSGEGMVIGLKSMIGLVGGVSTEVGDTAIKSISKAISNVSKLVTDGIDGEPTIRPVIDFSNLENGMYRFDELMNKNRTLNVNLANINGVINSTKKTSTNSKSSTKSKQESGPSIINQFDCTGMIVQNASDIDEIATKLYDKQKNSMRGRGIKNY